MQTSKLFVGNISFRAKEADLRDLFKPYGAVRRVRIPTIKETGASRGFAFVEMETVAQAEKSLEALNGQNFMGRELLISEAKPRADQDR